MIAIIGAMQVEIDALVSAMNDIVTKTEASTKYHSGTLSGKSVVVACCGIGKVNAAMTTSLLLANFDVSVVVNIGVAGGLSRTLKVGDIVVSDKCVQYDYQADLTNSPTAHNVDRIGLTYLPCDPVLTNALAATIHKMGHVCEIGTIATGDRFVADKTMAEHIAHKFGAKAVEMESGAIAQVCRLFGTRFVSLRTLSDSANNNAEFDFGQYVKETARKSCAIMLQWLQDCNV
ncbi:MAG: 5'-methylthioadenosine/adenosylhomocysteine nucleosidase [Clostridiales bacterium]|nr:5'-methylthioadenosine/adenosylhomocysteine nucleosidase [Clostridiales bacterium]